MLINSLFFWAAASVDLASARHSIVAGVANSGGPVQVFYHLNMAVSPVATGVQKVQL
jgi:hypothetical protein